MKIPKGQGMWPAFWLLGDDISTVGWPTCGEIDVMENIGKNPTIDYGTIHGPQGSSPYGVGKSAELPSKAPLGDDYHVYAVEWDATTVKFFLDDAQYASPTAADLPSGGKWVFDHSFFLLVNLAVGGSWPGDPDGTTTFPAELRVDWVRVYTKG
jgi:beta-glucanase (GH16 family)